VCLAFSAFYELIEWATAMLTGEAADAFLGTQGDPWDTQTDMLMALIGAIAALLLLRRAHDRSVAAVTSSLAPTQWAAACAVPRVWRNSHA
jgi:putative membrane protein